MPNVQAKPQTPQRRPFSHLMTTLRKVYRLQRFVRPRFNAAPWLPMTAASFLQHPDFEEQV